MTRRREAGAATLALLLLIVAIAGGAGWWNYQRNLALEEEEYRPFRGYSDADLDALADAYQGLRERHNDRYEAVADQRARARSGSHLDEKVREFERVQQVHARKKQAQHQLAGSQASVKEIEKELRRRKREGSLDLFMKRLLTLP